jgi:hypothetical protein
LGRPWQMPWTQRKRACQPSCCGAAGAVETAMEPFRKCKAAGAVMRPPQCSKRQTTAPALGSLGSCEPGWSEP